MTGSTPRVVVWDMNTLTRSGAAMTVPTSSWTAAFDNPARHFLVTDPFVGRAQIWDEHTRLIAGPAIPIRAELARGDMSPDGREVLLAGISGYDVHRLPRTPTSLNDMRYQTWASVGHRMDENGDPVRVSQADWRRARAEVHRQRATTPPTSRISPVRRLVIPHASSVIAYINNREQAVSRDEGRTWITKPRSVAPDTVSTTPHGTFALSSEGRTEVFAGRENASTSALDMGASTAMLGHRMVMHTSRASHWYSNDHGATWGEQE